MGGRNSNAQRGHAGQKGVQSCKDMQELRDHMWNTHRVYLAKGLDAVDLGIMKSSMANLERLFSEFPALKRMTTGKNQPMLKEVNAGVTGSGVYANVGNRRTIESLSEISVNPSMFKNGDSIAKSYQSDVKAGFHPAGTDSTHILVHEAGHVMEAALIRKAGLPVVSAWNSHKEATRILSEACKLVKKTPAGKMTTGKSFTNDQLISKVSKYATKNRAEAMSECVADYFANGNNANPLSIQVWNILKKELK